MHLQFSDHEVMTKSLLLLHLALALILSFLEKDTSKTCFLLCTSVCMLKGH